LRFLKRAVAAWWNDNAIRLGASLSYYTLFALAPMLLVAIAIAGSAFGEEAVRGEIVGQVNGLIGNEGGVAVQALLKGAALRGDSNLAAIIGSITFFFAACGAFLELQSAFNTIWRVTPSPSNGGQIKEFVLDRIRSFGLVVAIGFLLMVSLAVTSALFAMLFKFLPDVELSWPDVATGALVTALLFSVGKNVIGLYIGHSATASAYGAAGSVLVLLLWVYYTSQIVLVGAEFTRLYAERVRGPVSPSSFAERTPRKATA